MTVLTGADSAAALAGPSGDPVVVRVLPDVSGLDKQFDYRLPAGIVAQRPCVEAFVGALVRVPLHGRRVVGWIVAVDPPQPLDSDRLHDVIAVVSHGPAPELLELAEWAAVRWAAGRLRPFLGAASPARRVPVLPAERRGSPVEVASDDPVVAAHRALVGEPGAGHQTVTIAVAPTTSPLSLIADLARDGPVLAVFPSVTRAAAMAAALRRKGLAVALLPDGWAQAAAGVDVVVGARAAAWAPCPGLRSVVLVDEHDEAHQEERAPTWHAREVLAERARRAAARLVLTSPAPSVATCLYEPRGTIEWGALVSGWTTVEIVDRGDEEPWRSSLITSRLIHFLRQPQLRVVCVHNVPGRSRVLACRSCRQLARCGRCDAAVGLADDGCLTCARCGEQRPQVCTACGGGAFANLKPGVTRLAEELSAAAGRRVVSVTGATTTPPEAGVYVGTEAVLHRVAHADVVAFLDIDRELLAPRFRAPEQTLALLVRGARLLGPRRRGGRLLIQTYLPDDPVLQAVLRNDPLAPSEGELPRRAAMRMPPTAALAAISGEGADELVVALRGLPPAPGHDVTTAVGQWPALRIGGGAGRYVVGADDWMSLGAALLEAKRVSGTRPRIEVDPPRA